MPEKEKKFCPILAIGFDPPEEGKQDMRLCSEECAWFDIDRCAIQTIIDRLEYLQSLTEDTNQILSEEQYTSVVDETEYEDYVWEQYNKQ